MTFRTAYFKLTLFYVLIVMVISIGFSVIIYELSTIELNRGLDQQTEILKNLPRGNYTQQFPDFEMLRLTQLAESAAHLRTNLIYFNLSILVFSSIACYFLAKKTLQPIEEAMETQNRFTADASHELRTPLAAMKTEIEVNLRDKDLNLQKAKKLLQSNLEEIQKLETLSGTLLQLARFDSTAKKNFEKLSLEDVICEAYEKVAALADKKSISFNNKLSNISVSGDHRSLVQLFVILLDNAIKYSPNKSKISITISREKFHTANHAIVKVRDLGCGIPEEDIPHIFDRFYRSDTSRCKDKTEGFGLGLSIAKQIIDYHNGHIFANPKLKRGSEFVVKLPLKKQRNIIS